MTTKIKSNRNISNNQKPRQRFNGSFDIIIRSDGIELTEKLKEAVVRKISRVRQYAPGAFRARVQLEREHMKAGADQFRVSVRYEIPGHDILAEHRAHEPMAALDLVAEKLERRLRKRKTARLASRLGRRGKPCRITDFCADNVITEPRRI